jgi:hypothetical protein
LSPSLFASVFALIGPLIDYTALTTSGRLQRLDIKTVIPLGVASWLTVGVFVLLTYLNVISKERLLIGISALVAIFITGTYLGNLLLRKSRPRWWLE